MSFKHISLDWASLIFYIMGYHGFHYLREFKPIIFEQQGEPVTPWCLFYIY